MEKLKPKGPSNEELLDIIELRISPGTR